MADTADVERALVAMCAGALFPPGSYTYSAVAASTVVISGAAALCRLYRGWPATDTLNSDLAKGISHISIYPEAGMGRTASRYLTKWWQAPQTAPTLSWTLVPGPTSCVVTWNGTATAGQIAGIAIGPGFAPATYSYTIQPGDTPTSVAGAFAAMIGGASMNGPVLTVPGSDCVVRVVQGASATWLARQITQRYRLNLWCPTPQARDAVAEVVDLAMAQTFRLPMPDRSPALLRYGGTLVSDLPARQGEWNRTLIAIVEYSTVVVQNLPAVLFPAGSLNSAGFGVAFGAAQSPPILIYSDLAGNVLTDIGGSPMGGNGVVSPASVASPNDGYETTEGAVLVDVFGNPVIGP